MGFPFSGTIIIVGDDDGAAASWGDILRRGGFGIELCRNVSDLPTTEGLYASVIADGRSAGGAFSLCRTLERFRCPITLVGPCDEVDKVVAVEMGADDFIDHGIDAREFLARIRAQIRSYRKSFTVTAPPSRDSWMVQSHLRRVTSPSGKSVYLTPSELRLFSLLCCNAGGHLTSEKLVQALRLDGDVEGNLRSLMTRLRKKLASVGEDPIRTLYGQGYEFTASVSVASPWS